MRFMVFVKSSDGHERGEMPDAKLLKAMGAFNEELKQAGVLVDGNGLHPSAKGARVMFQGPKRSVVDGPFAEAKELVGGYWIWKCESLGEAIGWAKKCPNPHPMAPESVIEIRQLFELEDYSELPADLKARYEKK
jgi:hypothetical protein